MQTKWTILSIEGRPSCGLSPRPLWQYVDERLSRTIYVMTSHDLLILIAILALVLAWVAVLYGARLKRRL